MRPLYEERLQARRSAHARHDAAFRLAGNLRLAIVVAAALIAWLNFYWLPLPALAFIALIIWHDRISRGAEIERRAATFYERALARLDGSWIGSGADGQAFCDVAHPYGNDLDIFGRGSLFQLINAARTSVGEATLAAWLRAASPAEVVIERQAAVSDLTGRLQLREDLFVIGEDVQTSIEPESLASWGEAPPVGFPRAARWITAALAVLTFISFSGYMLQFWRLAWLMLALLADAFAVLWLRRPTIRVLGSVDVPARELNVLALVLARFEREAFRSGRLAELRSELSIGGHSAAQEIARLRRLIEYRQWELHQVFAIFAKPLLWSEQFAIAIEAWRVRHGRSIRRWLAAIGELEALSSLAGYAAEHPEDPFPKFADEGPLFDGHGIAHPLLPAAVAVRNDVRLDDTLRLLIVSGSNMSGKSTLLRAVAVNAVLAWAGAPVRARGLRVSPLVVGASMRLQDSVLEGKSRFYAEIMRIRQIMDLAAGSPPLLFVLDEILSGTNSHDRRIGAEAIMRTLVARSAIGLVTTHDLALAGIAGALGGSAANVHFEDHLENGRIAFDYQMRPGVVTKSNALELMRTVGLEV